jgi:hypothetical protein
LKTTAGAANDYIYPKEVFIDSSISWNRRVMTWGAWVKTDEASHVRLRGVDGATLSSYHTGGDDWEWLEVTSTAGAGTAPLHLIWFVKSGETAYIAQPMLVYGSSIGEGNYTRPQGEWVYMQRKHLTGFSGDSFSDASNQTINLEAVSDGMIPKGAKAIMCRLQARDSDTATGTPYVQLMGEDLNIPSLEADCQFADAAGRDDVYSRVNGIVPCKADGDINYYTLASGSSTLDVFISVYAVQLR